MDSPTNITRSDISTVVATLLGNNAYTISDIVEGEDRFGTAPVRNSYFVLSNTQLTTNLEGVDGFTHVSQYASQRGILPVEWGSVGNTRFMISSIGSTSPNASNLNATVFNNFVVGMEAIGVVEQNQYSAQFIYRPPIYSDPLAMNASVGYKMAQCPRIFNDAWIVNLRCTLLN